VLTPTTNELQPRLQCANKRGESIPSLNLAPFGRWTLRDKAAQRRLALRWASNMRTLAALFLSLLFAATAQAGAWGEGSFDNDDALDWAAECSHSSSPAMVGRTLRAVLDAKYIEAPSGSAAVAAAEVVAAALGKPSTKLPADLQSWVGRQPAGSLSQLAPLAKTALARVQDPKASELRQLWSEGKPNGWGKVIADLEARLGK
jgi:hypothetical protein